MKMKQIVFAAFIAASALFTGCQAPEAWLTTGVNEPIASKPTAKATNATVNEKTRATAEPLAYDPPTSDSPIIQANAGSGTQTLSILTYLYNNDLEAIANQFESHNPGVDVVIHPFLTQINRSDNDAEQYEQAVTTALTGGQGEDIVSVGFPLEWRKFAEAGLLADLNEYITFPEGKYYQNVLDAYLYNGKRYMIPLAFTFNAYEFSDAYISETPEYELTLNDLTALKQKYPGQRVFQDDGGFFTTPVADHLFQSNYRSYLDLENRTANLDNERFVSFLNNVQALSEGTGNGSMMQMVSINSPAISATEVKDYSKVFLLTDEAGRHPFSGSSPFLGFSPTVNANSPNKELAAKFIEYLLSDEVQTSSLFSASPQSIIDISAKSPVNVKANAEMARLNVNNFANIPANFDIEKNILKFNELAKRLTHPTLELGMSYNHLIYFEMQNFFTGESTAEQAAANSQAGMNTYFSN